jgi:hypothetical protein
MRLAIAPRGPGGPELLRAPRRARPNPKAYLSLPRSTAHQHLSFSPRRLAHPAPQDPTSASNALRRLGSADLLSFFSDSLCVFCFARPRSPLHNPSRDHRSHPRASATRTPAPSIPGAQQPRREVAPPHFLCPLHPPRRPNPLPHRSLSPERRRLHCQRPFAPRPSAPHCDKPLLRNHPFPPTLNNPPPELWRTHLLESTTTTKPPFQAGCPPLSPPPPPRRPRPPPPASNLLPLRPPVPPPPFRSSKPTHNGTRTHDHIYTREIYLGTNPPTNNTYPRAHE